MTDQSNTSAGAISVAVRFWWPTVMFSPNSRLWVFPSGARGTNQGTDARLPDGSGANSR